MENTGTPLTANPDPDPNVNVVSIGRNGNSHNLFIRYTCNGKDIVAALHHNQHYCVNIKQHYTNTNKYGIFFTFSIAANWICPVCKKIHSLHIKDNMEED